MTILSNLKYILTIAGHDPSGGAGITSDIKTFEAHGVYGLSVCTAITVQNEKKVKDCIWVPVKTVLAQIEVLYEQYEIEVVKIGIIESWSNLLQVVNKLKALNPTIKTVLDPILKASSGYDFHAQEDQEVLGEIWKNCYIITPNYEEIKNVYPQMTVEDTIAHIANFTNIYLKGGHREDKKGYDELYYSQIVMVNLPPFFNEISHKHGSGCVLSSALASNLALGITLEDAARIAKKYTEEFLNSHPSLLGIHTKIKAK
ncbi:hydroxymethylpyrimidine/phosphomethylpyrimidine kinase [Maribacter sp. LLG6340-A2]|uniref:hydroxymethylpyrimidine/phosphomethylpyrimidine kinase n=1 Tax=Maribacter sp. LLG6340-A2 TaxID=3160834 RepID=UPI003864BAC3